MKNLLIKGNKALAIVTGILFFGILLNNISVRKTVSYVQANQSEEIGTSSIVANVDMENQLTASEVEYNSTSYVADNEKVANVRNYLANRGAPLAEYAEVFVTAADYYNIDYRLVAAISVIESSGGEHTFRPYNAWGWGKMTFENWEQGIWTVSEGLAKYYSRGLTTPDLISTYYCPPNATNWARNVNYVMNAMEI